MDFGIHITVTWLITINGIIINHIQKMSWHNGNTDNSVPLNTITGKCIFSMNGYNVKSFNCFWDTHYL